MLESHGYINGIDEVVNILVREVEPVIRNVIERKKAANIKLDNADIIKDVNTFFNRFKVSFSFIPTDDSRTRIHGSTDVLKSVDVDSEDNVISCPEIVMKVNCGTNLTDAVDRVSVNLSHELTHAYNIYRYAAEKGIQSLWNNITKTQRYSKIRSVQDSNVNNRSVIGNVLYTLNRMERNSYIAETRRELYLKKDEIVDAKTGFEAVKNSNSYRTRFKLLERNVSALTTITNPGAQNVIATAVNDAMGRKFTNYEQVKRYLINRWVRWKKKYLSAVSKMIYDICDENTVMLDNGPIEKGKTLKNY